MSVEFELRTRDGRILKVTREWMRFGRADDNDIVVRDAAVSRYHLNFYIKDNQLIVEDAGSQNGYLINGRQAEGAVTLNSGDKIVVGTMEYTVKNPLMPEPTHQTNTKPAEAFARVVSDISTSEDPSKKRIRIYAIAVIALVVIMAGSRMGEKKTAKDAATMGEADTPLPSQGYRPDTYHTQSISEIHSEAKFHEAMRDYDDGHFSRALIGFQESRTLNPENDEATKYVELSESRMTAQITTLLKDANTSAKNLQYRRAKGQAVQILTILSEQVAGYGRMIAQQTSVVSDQQRSPGQEETIIKLPCDQTHEEKICKEAKDIISESRRRLGEEDVLK